MLFAELVAEVAEDARLPRTTVASVLYSFIKVVTRTLLSGQQVRLRKFGTFYTVVPTPKPLFGGARQQKGEPVFRFKRSRYGEVRRRD
jgi:nucleoid DNA-binding protein